MFNLWIVVLRHCVLVWCLHGASLPAVFGLSTSCSTTRRQFFKGASAFVPILAGAESLIVPMSLASDLSDESPNRDSMTMSASIAGRSNNVAYKTVTLNIPRFGVQIPVACWFPTIASAQSAVPFQPKPKYRHRISVRRIGELLAGWEFIPEFASKNFEFSPTLPSGGPLVNGERMSIPLGSQVVILSHGFLGSRFDLSHIAEDLAAKGFVCFSPEYPESLAASYQRVSGLDRETVNNALLEYIETTVKPTAYGVVGHSLGCGTALRLGDASWARVLIAGPPAPEDCPSPVLLITSTNDVFVRSSGRSLVLPSVYQRLQENNLPAAIPRTSALIFDRPNGPNHISYLSENVNDSMVSFLSPLLPLAQALSIPVLDFDTYQKARDAKPTAAIIRPLISSFMVQQMASPIEVR